MNKLGIGTAQFGMDYGINSTQGKVTSDEIKKILEFAKLHNINLLDTAFSYGTSEKSLGVNDISKFRVVTKIKKFMNNSITKKDIEMVDRDTMQSLQNLNQRNIFGLLIHDCNDLNKPGSNLVISYLERLKREKKVTKIGVSAYNRQQILSVIDRFSIDIIQVPLNILDRRLIEDGTIAMLASRGIEVHVRSIFLQGLLLMPKESRPSKFNHWARIWNTWEEWLKDYNISALQASVRFALTLPNIANVIVGIDNVKQLDEIIQASEGNLPKLPNEFFTSDERLLNPSNWEQL